MYGDATVPRRALVVCRSTAEMPSNRGRWRDGPAGARLRALVVVMPHVAGRDHEDHVLRDVGGVVADALEVARNQHQVERRLDGLALAGHVFEQRLEDLRLQLVQL